MAKSVNLTDSINSQTQEAARNRLLSIFDRRKREEGLTQVVLASRLGMNQQSSVSQYLKGRVELNTAAVLNFAQALDCSPMDIYPELMEPVRRLFTPRVHIHVRYALHGDPTVLNIESVEVHEDLNPYAVEINNTDYAHIYPFGTFLVCSNRVEAEEAMEVFIELTNGEKFIATLKNTSADTGEYTVRHTLDDRICTYPAREIAVCDVVVGVHRSSMAWKMKK